MTQTVRNEHIDIMKGFAILLVLLGHRFMTNTAEGARHPVAIIIYSFHMAFFFFISGYVNEYTNQLARKGVKRFISDKIQTLILPFLVWTLICYLSNDGNYSLKGLVDSFNFYPAKGYWFLPVLFLFFIIYLSVKKIGLKLGGGNLYRCPYHHRPFGSAGIPNLVRILSPCIPVWRLYGRHIRREAAYTYSYIRNISANTYHMLVSISDGIIGHRQSDKSRHDVYNGFDELHHVFQFL